VRRGSGWDRALVGMACDWEGAAGRWDRTEGCFDPTGAIHCMAEPRQLVGQGRTKVFSPNRSF